MEGRRGFQRGFPLVAAHPCVAKWGRPTGICKDRWRAVCHELATCFCVEDAAQQRQRVVMKRQSHSRPLSLPSRRCHRRPNRELELFQICFGQGLFGVDLLEILQRRELYERLQLLEVSRVSIQLRPHISALLLLLCVVGELPVEKSIVDIILAAVPPEAFVPKLLVSLQPWSRLLR